MATISEIDVYEQEVDKAIQIKKELYQFKTLSENANIISWNIGKQIKNKNQELIELKKKAGKVQSLSVSNTYEETLEYFSKAKGSYILADTLADYSSQLIAISGNSIEFEIPESELAFAGEMKNKFLLAQAQKTKPAVYDENIPIVFVDKRKNANQLASAVNEEVISNTK